MMMSGRFAASLAMLLAAAVLYLVAIGTHSWAASGQGVLTLGLWKFCMQLQGPGQGQSDLHHTWRCLPNKTDFSLAAQAFSMLAVLCYAVSFLLYLACIVLPSLARSRPLTMALCLLGFSVVCLQMMTMMVYGVKMDQLFRRVERVYFMRHLDPLTLASSFTFAIISSVLATAAGICTFLELRNLTLDDLRDAGVLPA
ncbi:uncharacterized protein LOC143280093 [Babylonia areolata]|uniref:uncharacterized protein LOC143280093 n=1 Tax=Babylonia areolata TaxID=304850 RepID=UPI003FCF582C